MKGRWMSYIYVPVLASFLACMSIFLWRDQTEEDIKKQEQIYYLDSYFTQQETAADEAHAVDDKNVVLEPKPQEQAPSGAQFVLRLENNYVTVYRSDNHSECYMSTGICTSDLPEKTREEIKNGKEILDEEALYFFLESYSS